MGATVTLSWWGIHSAMEDTGYIRPPLLILSGEPDTVAVIKPSISHPTTTPSATRSPAGTSDAPSRSGSGSLSPGASTSPSPHASPSKSTSPSASPQGGDVQARTVKGGRVAFDMGSRSATLVSATPAAGWQMQQWHEPEWIRVTFSKDGEEVSVICSWHDHAPLIEIWTS